MLREELTRSARDGTRIVLPMPAARALARGLDSPAPREVAGSGRVDPAAEAFSFALREPGLSWPTEGEAHLHAARRLCACLFEGDPGPAESVNAAEEVYHHLCTVASEGAGRYDCIGFLQVCLRWESLTAGGVVPAPDECRSIVERTRAPARSLLAESAGGHGPGGRSHPAPVRARPRPGVGRRVRRTR